MARISITLFLFVTYLLLLFAGAAEAGVEIAGSYAGRYQCGNWNTVELQISEAEDNSLAGIFTFPVKAARNSEGEKYSYSLAGRYEPRNGRFRLDPRSWIGRPPLGYVMVGMEGVVDPDSRTLSGRITYHMCGRFELAPIGTERNAIRRTRRPPAPSVADSGTRNASPRYLPPERSKYPTNVTGNTTHWFEYVDATFSDPEGTVREEEPIDAVIDWLNQNEFSCVDKRRVVWHGEKGEARNRVSVIERYVIECSGNCRGVRYKPKASAIIVHFGATQPAPVLQIKSPWLGGTDVLWEFTRDSTAEKPPDISIYRWTGGKFNSGPGCEAPKASDE